MFGFNSEKLILKPLVIARHSLINVPPVIIVNASNDLSDKKCGCYSKSSFNGNLEAFEV
jgi:hypothetical protein